MVANRRHVQGHHFLMVIVAAQSHINPARHLARRLARTAKARVTITTPLSSHRRLFPESSAKAGEPDDAIEDSSGVIAYAPYSDGFDEEDHLASIDPDLFMERLKSVGPRTVAALLHNFIAKGRPVTCILYTNILTWAADVARDLSIPAIHYWIQPASVFAVYYHYFQGHPSFTFTADEKDSSFSIELPGLPHLRMKDLPSFITTPNAYLSAHKDIFEELGRYEKPIVLMNTFYELEASAMEGIPGMELISIGPSVDDQAVGRRDLFEEDEASGYMEWLDSQEERSVVYVAFGSLRRLTERQVEELDLGLKESGRPYLWVLRKDSRVELLGIGLLEKVLKEGKGKGKVVEWCSQMRVLENKAVGCFVTHCGWNSMSEAVTRGVAMVMVPQCIEQATNARLAEAAWGVGVTVEVGAEDGVVEAAELMRGVEVVMGEGERAREIRRKTEEWKEKAKAAIGENGLASRNLELFVNSLSKYK